MSSGLSLMEASRQPFQGVGEFTKAKVSVLPTSLAEVD